jgi:hypothetical protein
MRFFKPDGAEQIPITLFFSPTIMASNPFVTKSIVENCRIPTSIDGRCTANLATAIQWHLAIFGSRGRYQSLGRHCPAATLTMKSYS